MCCAVQTARLLGKLGTIALNVTGKVTAQGTESRPTHSERATETHSERATETHSERATEKRE